MILVRFPWVHFVAWRIWVCKSFKVFLFNILKTFILKFIFNRLMKYRGKFPGKLVVFKFWISRIQRLRKHSLLGANFIFFWIWIPLNSVHLSWIDYLLIIGVPINWIVQVISFIIRNIFIIGILFSATHAFLSALMFFIVDCL